MIDLHTHSTFSDGSLTPEELVDLAVEVGLSGMALTDHDSTDGIARFMAACAAKGLRGVPGVEISIDVRSGTLHMLGYYVDTKEATLQEMLRRIRNGREIRNEEILRKLNDLGLTLTWEEVARHAGEDVVGRPHFAKALLDRGYVKTREAAFDLYLAKGKPAYTDRVRMSAEDSIAAIRMSGGVPVLSHPFTLGLDRNALRAAVAALRDQGLLGIEVYYSEHSREQVDLYLGLARDLGLAVSGGSDFHGQSNPAIHLGRGFGSLNVPNSVLDELERARGRLSP